MSTEARCPSCGVELAPTRGRLMTLDTSASAHVVDAVAALEDLQAALRAKPKMRDRIASVERATARLALAREEHARAAAALIAAGGRWP